jgi:hypothetical protein
LELANEASLAVDHRMGELGVERESSVIDRNVDSSYVCLDVGGTSEYRPGIGEEPDVGSAVLFYASKN